jgi:hypothetical protein
MTSKAFDRISGGFGFQTAPFAVHKLDRERAHQYKKEVQRFGVTPAEVAEDVRAYLAEASGFPVKVDSEVERVLKFVFGWFHQTAVGIC